MDLFDKISRWLETKRAPSWLDGLRVILGLFLFIKGLIFTANFQVLAENVQSMGFVYLAVIAAHYIYLVHTAGGLLLAIGGFTRLVSLLNLPILVSAVVFNYTHFLVMDNLMELEMSVLCLAGLCIFFVYGGGKYSMDALRRKEKDNKEHLIIE